MGVIQTFQYDTKGNQTAAQTQNSTATSFIKGTTGYTTDQNYVYTQTDARGKTVTRNIDLTKGTLTSVTDPNSQTVNYTYDTLKRGTGTTATADGMTYKNEYVYTDDKLTQVKHNTASDTTCDVVYDFAYDVLGNPTTVKVGTQTLSTNVYTSTGDKLLSRVDYGNGGKVEYIRDGYKRVTGIRHDGASGDRYQYSFGANGQVAQVKDNNLGRDTTHEYDSADRLMRVKQKEGTSHLYTSQLGYDTYNNLSSFKERVASTNYETTYAYDNGNRSTTVQFGSTSNKVGYEYDALGRVSTRTLTVNGGNYASTYGFEAGGHGTGSTTALVNSITQTGQNFTYTYDNVGNIATEVRGGYSTSYAYDNMGQLVRVNDQRAGTTWTYAYDRGGNILNKNQYAYTTGVLGTVLETVLYDYTDANWKDKLTSYNGVTISHDTIGNPGNDGTWAYTWKAGSQLESMIKTGTTATFAYNADGLRVRKTVNGTVTDYTLHGKQVVHVKQGSNNLHFFYDAQGRPAVVDFNGAKYGYVHNHQGDVVALIDGSGTQVVGYTYDAWGKLLTKTGTLAATLGTLNPFRYRGYVFDEETGLYYISSRYYNPGTCRFINADTTDVLTAAPMTLTDKNLFAYCDNNPVMRKDESGQFWNFISAAIGAAVGAVAGFVGQVGSDIVTSVLTGEVKVSNWQTYVGATVGGAVGGAILGATGCVGLANAASGFVTTAVGLSLEKLTIKGYDKSWGEIGINAAFDGVVSFGAGRIPGLKGVTKGRNSYSAVYKSGLSKLRNQTAARMSRKVFAKGFLSSAVGGLPMDAYVGVKQYAYDRTKRAFVHWF